MKKKASRFKTIEKKIVEDVDKIFHHHPHKEDKTVTDTGTKDKDKVTATTQLPPGGVTVQASNPEASANIISQAEAPKQAQKREKTESVVPEPDPNYKFEVEQAPHKVIAKVERGLSYNYHVVCTYCAWEGRYLYQDEAEDAAKDHLARKFPRRG